MASSPDDAVDNDQDWNDGIVLKYVVPMAAAVLGKWGDRSNCWYGAMLIRFLLYAACLSPRGWRRRRDSANLMNLSPLRAVREARKRQDLGDLNPAPFAALLINCIGWVVCTSRGHRAFVSSAAAAD